ncbi:hypothetical protein SAMN04489712_1342 [Thermomonospora echinospora]|uniref:Uncharacterized protein n=1 Tax=Thermomonospora echinospora TaxID=1992 RepID=A0A1H6E598_9ACTN|nr:hypothetical protein SAMN04489712_1342 [Thermomonospora echinospora]
MEAWNDALDADPSSPAPQPANNPWVTRNGDFSDDPPF